MRLQVGSGVRSPSRLAPGFRRLRETLGYLRNAISGSEQRYLAGAFRGPNFPVVYDKAFGAGGVFSMECNRPRFLGVTDLICLAYNVGCGSQFEQLKTLALTNGEVCG
jgi:hypothetical protein